jgi:hypothetical protein
MNWDVWKQYGKKESSYLRALHSHLFQEGHTAKKDTSMPVQQVISKG